MTTPEIVKQNKTKRFWLRATFVLVAYILPFTMMAIKFKLFSTQGAGIKIGVGAVIGGVILLFQFKKELFEWINAWEFGMFKVILLGFARVWWFIFALVLVALVKQGIESVEYIVGWVAIPNILAHMAIKPFAEKYDFLVKRELRKQEMREVINE